MDYSVKIILFLLNAIGVLSVNYGDDYCSKMVPALDANEERLCSFLYGDFERRATDLCTRLVDASWEQVLDIQNAGKVEKTLNVSIESARFEKHYWQTYFRNIDITKLSDQSLIRQFRRLKILGFSALSEDKLTKLTHLLNKMAELYSTARICPYRNPNCDIETQGLSLDPGIEEAMMNSRDYDELLYVWLSWREATGFKLRDTFVQYVDLANDAARANNFSDRGAMWRHGFEVPNLAQDVEDLWNDLQPLYNELHKYAYNKLRAYYPNEFGDDDDGLIPAHILGNMWGQSWINIRKLLLPFPFVSDVDITDILRERNISIIKMYDMANEFYTSMGMESMKNIYGTNSVLEKIPGREMLCHPSAWDFCNGLDFRVKMCTKKTQGDFITIHHELGHIQYYVQYKDLPIVYRAGANPAFHEAIGDTIAISVGTPAHYHKIGLIDTFDDSEEALLNALMDMALERVAYLPYAIVIDKWRWDIFGEKIEPDKWNAHYWHYREKYQKIKSPVPRSSLDLDAAAKFHITSDAAYIPYYFARILQFQFFKALCQEAGQYPRMPLYKCDLYRSKAAGARLMKGLKLGSSLHWMDVLEVLTGDKKVKADALLEYFQPLYNFLRRENALNTPWRKK